MTDKRAGMAQVEVCESGVHKHLSDADLDLCRLRQALQDIVDMKSCLLADAQAIAKDALSTTDTDRQRENNDGT